MRDHEDDNFIEEADRPESEASPGTDAGSEYGDTGYEGAEYDDAEYGDSGYEGAEYDDAEYGDSGYEGDEYADAEYEDPEYEGAEYADTERVNPEHEAAEEEGAITEGEEGSEAVDINSIPEEELAPYIDRDAFYWTKKSNRAKRIRMLAMVIFSFAALLFASIAWFTMSREVETGGMSMTSQANGFELRVSGTTIGNYNLYTYLDSNLTGNSGTITNNNQGGQVISWRLEDGEKAIKPGSQGELEFEVISNGANIDTLKYSLNITAYAATMRENPDPDDPDKTIEVVTGLTEITSSNSSGTKLDAVDYINTHVMFFTGRNGSSKDDYEYYGLISDKEEFNLTLVNGVGTIYWIWPNTLGQIAFSTGESTYFTGTPVLDKTASSYSTDRAAMTKYMKDNQTDFFSGNESYTALIMTMYTNWETRENPEPVSYMTEYEKLSEGYNVADQAIGNNIDYVLLHMTVDDQ